MAEANAGNVPEDTFQQALESMDKLYMPQEGLGALASGVSPYILAEKKQKIMKYLTKAQNRLRDDLDAQTAARYGIEDELGRNPEYT
jgi:hypothetical protein